MSSNSRIFSRALLASALCLANGAIAAEKEAEKSEQLENVEVTGEQVESYLTQDMDASTGLGLSIMDTPQSVSAISQVQLQDFKLQSLNDALVTVPGIQVESVETDRTYYTSRGFDITNFQVDGVGMVSAYGNQDGELDTALYERIEVVRGANGLMAGAGNPSATVNLVRKRPTDDLQLSFSSTVGSWDKLRAETDVSGTLTEGLRGRAVLVKEDRESWLDYYAMDKTVAYGVIEKDLGESTLFTLGGSYQSSLADSPLWGALPMHYTDGSPTDYDVSASTSAEWAYWDNIQTEVFAELKHEFSNGWQVKAYYNQADVEGESELFYMYSLPAPDTDVGLIGYASGYDKEQKREVFDVRVNGDYSLFGREHEVMFGYNWAKDNIEETSLYDYTNGYPPIGDFTQWNGQTPVRPSFTDGLTGSDFNSEQGAYFAATRLNLTDALSVIGGARVIDWESEGTGYGTSKATRESGRVLPYAGVVYRIDDNYSVYASHTETFMPQDDISEDLTYMDPTEGVNQEIGAKGAFFDGKLVATASYYQTEQNNVAEFLKEIEDPISGGPLSVYAGEDYDSDGYDLTLSGMLAEGLQADLSFTKVNIANKVGGELNRDYVPSKVVRLYASYRPPMLDQLKVGGGVNWQDDIQRVSATGATIQQDAYATLRLFANYQVSEQLSFSVNGNNLTDEKYISSLYWDQAFYAAPRNFSASVNWRY
ncbi:TonB-dependent siderophore receptor [Microbulbifer sp.]|uniref:TonB-dependent siderophore receptor n=1 Tax=Microbulbifer sp. TaxID=1908541 RepID=UPI00258C3682|nr:TonB-dependent siderophore receptor [Microbulbifer sp.]